MELSDTDTGYGRRMGDGMYADAASRAFLCLCLASNRADVEQPAWFTDQEQLKVVANRVVNKRPDSTEAMQMRAIVYSRRNDASAEDLRQALRDWRRFFELDLPPPRLEEAEGRLEKLKGRLRARIAADVAASIAART